MDRPSCITLKSHPAGLLSSSQLSGPACWASPLAFGLIVSNIHNDNCTVQREQLCATCQGISPVRTCYAAGYVVSLQMRQYSKWYSARLTTVWYLPRNLARMHLLSSDDFSLIQWRYTTLKPYIREDSCVHCTWSSVFGIRKFFFWILIQIHGFVILNSGSGAREANYLSIWPDLDSDNS